MPQINENEYLEKTKKILNKKIEQNSEKLKSYEQEFAQKKKELSDEYSEISRGGDLSQVYSSIADYENIEKYFVFSDLLFIFATIRLVMDI